MANNKRLDQIKNTLESIRLYVKDCENLMNEYSGSYTLEKMSLNCDNLEESIKDLKDLIIAEENEISNLW